ncbi:MAG TPA: protein-methionine-sulfoxide reductase heme-binding subunit MsrQ [Bryobacteraceae bacterium]|nr:protein-methionine-sulfoxide reductase heme-binding subunit MsrQ [Bryobacteraceae bacterium]
MRVRLLKAAAWIACLTPLALLIWRGFHDDLGGNPVEKITHTTGDWTLRFLLITLAITPLRKTFGPPRLIRFRRLLGLFAFFYGVLHVLTWLWLDKYFNVSELLADVRKRPFITAGTVAFLSLVPLALTSTAGWIRRLGGRRWQALHRLIYLSAAAAVVHYYWLVKSDIRLPVLYGAVFALLMLWRVALRRPTPSSARRIAANTVSSTLSSKGTGIP